MRLDPVLEGREGIVGLVDHTPPGHDVADLRCEVGAFAVQRVAVDAGVLLPDALAASDGFGQWHAAVDVFTMYKALWTDKPKKYQNEEIWTRRRRYCGPWSWS